MSEASDAPVGNASSPSAPQPPSDGSREGRGFRGWWRRRSRWLRWLMIGVPAAVLAYTLIGFFLVPLAIRHWIVPSIGKRMNGDIALADARFNPYAFTLELDGFEMRDWEGRRTVAFERFEGDFELWRSLFRPGWQFRHLRLHDPYAFGEVGEDGVWNFAKLFRPDPEPEEKEPLRKIPHLVIDELTLTNGAAQLTDLTLPEPFALAFSGLSFTHLNLDTAPENDNEHHLLATTDTGASIEWTGLVKLDPFRSHGTIAARQLALARFMPYGMRFTDARVVDGRLGFDVSYDLAPLRTPATAKFNVTDISIDQLALQREGGELATLPRVFVDEVAVDAYGRSVDVGRVEVAGGRLIVARDEHGVINLANLVMSADEAVAPSDASGDATGEADDEARTSDVLAAAPPAPGHVGAPAAGEADVPPVTLPSVDATLPDAPAPEERIDPLTIPYPVRQLVTALTYLAEDLRGSWSFSVKELEVTGQEIDLSDRFVDPPAALQVQLDSLRAGPARSDEGVRVPFSTSMSVQGEGTVTAEGVLSVAERSLAMDVTVDQLELAAADPYVALFLSPPLESPRLRSLRAGMEARVEATAPAADAIAATWKGALRLADAALVDGADGSPLAGAEGATAEGEASLDARDNGHRVTWTGTLALLRANGSPSFFKALGLGEGEATLESWTLDGAVEASWSPMEALASDGAPEQSGAPSATPHAAENSDGVAEGPARPGLAVEWTGKTTASRLSARQMALAGPTDADLSKTVVDGRAAVTLRDARASLHWQGSLALEEAAIEAPQAARISTRLAALSLGGELSASAQPHRQTTLRWDGQARIDRGAVAMHTSEAEGAVESLRLDAAAASLDVDGTLDGALSADQSTITWSGTVRAEDAAAAQRLASAVPALPPVGGALAPADVGAEGLLWSATAETLALAGDASGSAVEGRLELGWQGSVEVAAPAMKAAEGQMTCVGSGLTAEGALRQTADERLTWGGVVELREPLLRLDVAATELATAALRIEGDAALTRGDALALEHRGVLSLSDAKLTRGPAAAAASAVAGPDGGAATPAEMRTSIATLRLDGELALRGGEATALGWVGEVTAEDLAAHLAGDSANGAGPLAVSAQAVRSQSDVSLEGPAGAMRWKGSIEVSGAGVERPEGVPRSASATGMTVTGDAALGEAGEATFVGDLLVSALSSALAEEVALGVDSLAFRKVDLAQAAGTLRVGQVVIEAPSIEGDVGLAPADDDAPRDPDATRAAPAGAGRRFAEMLPWAVTIDSLRLGGGRIALRDTDVDPPVSMLVEAITLEAGNVSTEGTVVSSLSASGEIQGSGRFEATGELDPFRALPVADVTITLTGVPLPHFSAFSGRFAGYRVDQGRLSVDLPMSIVDGQVDGTLGFLLDKLKLGQKVDSPDAPKIPIELGLALLRDSNDQIKGQVPFSGDMTDPSFSFGGLIWHAVLSLFGKVATAPFQLLASAFGGGADLDLSFAQFEPGKSTLTSDALSKIDILAKGLAERPQIRMTIRGQFAREADVAALRPGLLREQVKAQLRQSFPDLEVVSDDVYRQVVLSMHAGLPPERQAGQSPSFEQAEQAVLATMDVTEEMLRELAQARAQRIADVMLKEKGVDAARLEVLVPEGEAAEAETPRTSFEIG